MKYTLTINNLNTQVEELLKLIRNNEEMQLEEDLSIYEISDSYKTALDLRFEKHLKGESKNQLYLTAGINASGSSTIFNLYDRDEWKSSIGGSIGFIWKIKGTTDTSENLPKLNHDLLLREHYIRDSILKDYTVNYSLENYQDVRKKYIHLSTLPLKKNDTTAKDNLVKYFKVLEKNETFYKRLENNKNLKEIVQSQIQNENKKNGIKETKVFLKFAHYTPDENNKNDIIIAKLLKEFWSENKDKNSTNEEVSLLKKIFKKVAIKNDSELEKAIKKVAAVYDQKNIKNTGYSLGWFDLNATLNNDTFGFSEKKENIVSDVKDAFEALDVEKTAINKLNVTLSLNYNYTRNKYRNAYYIKFGAQYNSGSFLSSNLIQGTPKIANIDTNGLFLINDYISDVKAPDVLGNFKALKENLQFGTFSFYSAYYFGKKKTIGLNLSLLHRYLITKPETTFYKNNYSVFFGPIFRKPKKDDDTGLTFGIDVGYDNALYGRSAKKNFIARIRVGIPLKLYNIKK